MTKIVEYSDVLVARNDLVVLKNVNLSLEQGDFLYLIGRVGSGKSSLLKTMYAEVPIASGEAAVLQYNIRKIKRRQVPKLRRQIGIVFQDFQLLTDRSARENLEFVLKATGWKRRGEIKSRIEEVLTQVGMATKAHKMPHQLSGGEQQRIVIARALLNDPTLILADEPTGNLDPETSSQIVALLHDISRHGTAVIMATHNIHLVEEYPARVMKCEGKRVTENPSKAAEAK